jgi:hypothetical protein
MVVSLQQKKKIRDENPSCAIDVDVVCRSEYLKGSVNQQSLNKRSLNSKWATSSILCRDTGRDEPACLTQTRQS